MKKLDDGYPDLGFRYNNKGHGISNGWKWTAIISLGLSVLLTVSFLLYVVLHSSIPVNVEPQGEYWRTHDNTRLGDDEIDKWLSEYLGGDSEHPSDDVQSDEEIIVGIINGLIEKIYQLDADIWMYLKDENILDYVEYQFEPVINRYAETRDTVHTNYGLEEGRLPKNSSLYSLLVGAGMTSIAAGIIVGSYSTIKVAGGTAAFLPFTAPAMSLIILGALAVMAGTILAFWSAIVKITAALIKFFTDVVPRFLNGIIVDFFSRTFGNARKHVEQRYDNRVYVKTTLDKAFIAKEASSPSKRNVIYIVLGSNKPSAGGQIILGMLVGVATGGIDEKYAVTIMKRTPGIMSNVGGMVVSIYTYLDSTARRIATQAGNGVPAIRHDKYSSQGAVKVGNFNHYHNGAMIALYPPKPNDKNDALPHAFFGNPVV